MTKIPDESESKGAHGRSWTKIGAEPEKIGGRAGKDLGQSRKRSGAEPDKN